MFIAEQLISIIAPHHCLICGDEGNLLCQPCSMELVPLPSRCYGCQKATPDSAVCERCRRAGRLRHVWTTHEYEGPVKRLVHALKFERASAAAGTAAALMIDSLPLLPKETLVTHLPTASSRRRQRGYDQSELLAKAIARKLGLGYAPLLMRIGQARQVGAKREQRLMQLEKAFRSVRKEMLRGRPVLLVDDIVTTGASLRAAAAVLQDAGAAEVNALVFAQKI